MKQWSRICLCLMLMISLAGCSSSSQTSDRAKKKTNGVSEVLEAGMAEADAEKTPESTIAPEIPEITAIPETPESTMAAEMTPEAAEEPADAYENIDIDLTVMSSTMVYSQVSEIMADPDAYVGKIMKMKGLLTVFHSEETGKYYFGCLIQDATACCAQGIEFELAGDYQYPDDYPPENTVITVVGVFDTYIEGVGLYCTLRNAEFA
ncbi:MAG: hypothetical protein IKG34_09100 [Solobacterium sp.]|nr:hypothetical protein [Solobacterium sp.]